MKIVNSIFKFLGSVKKVYKIFGVLMETAEFAKKRLQEENLLPAETVNSETDAK